MHKILRGDVRSFSRHYRGEKFHAMVCDPPYELGFMGKDWDKTGIVFDPETWAGLCEHLHPGGFGMAFASSRGWHRLAVAIEDAGLRIHPSIFGWVFGSGFPKATRIDTQIDKAAGVEREVVGQSNSGMVRINKRNAELGYRESDYKEAHSNDITAPSTDLARAWEGHRYGLQAMKPALEPIIVFQKPYAGKPVESIVETGAGALNIDGARIPLNGDYKCGANGRPSQTGLGDKYDSDKANLHSEVGRWPANFYVDEEAAARLGEQSGELGTGGPSSSKKGKFSGVVFSDSLKAPAGAMPKYDRGGTAARFFFNVNRQIDEADPVMYQAKASRKERDAGLDEFDLSDAPGSKRSKPAPGRKNALGEPRRNAHPTVKPIDLCRWLATLLLPPAEYGPRRILVPFSGSGSEMIGAHLAGWEEIVGIEMDRDYVNMAKARMAYWTTRPEQGEFGFWLHHP